MAFSSLVKTINDAADPSLYSNATEVERMELLSAIEKLQVVVETPMQATWKTLLAAS
jgi:hypothetical protein